MKTGLPATNLVTLMSALGLTRKQSSEMTASWNAWKDGEITRAQALAREALAARHASDEAHHLLFLTAFVTGDRVVQILRSHGAHFINAYGQWTIESVTA